MTRRFLIYSASLILISLQVACYSFKNVSLPPELDTFGVDNFGLLAQNAPATLDRDFTEALKDKIRRESKLNLVAQDPDVLFSGNIVGFDVKSVAPQPGETVAFNRLTIRIKVNYENFVQEDKDYDQVFSFFADFPNDAVLTDVQDELIDVIFTQILEDIFNKTFTDW